MKNEKQIKLIYDSNISDIELRRRRLKEIIKVRNCRSLSDCTDYYLKCYDDDNDVAENSSYLSKALRSIKGLATDENDKPLKNEDGYFYLVDYDEGMEEKLKNIYVKNDLKVYDMRTIIIDSKQDDYQALLKILNEKQRDIVDIKVIDVSHNIKRIIVSYKTELRELSINDKNCYVYDADDLGEVFKSIEMDIKEENSKL